MFAGKEKRVGEAVKRVDLAEGPAVISPRSVVSMGSDNFIQEVRRLDSLAPRTLGAGRQSTGSSARGPGEV